MATAKSIESWTLASIRLFGGEAAHVQLKANTKEPAIRQLYKIHQLPGFLTRQRVRDDGEEEPSQEAEQLPI